MQEIAAPTAQTTLSDLFALQKTTAQTLKREPLSARKQRLKALRAWIVANRPAIHQAMHDDFRKNPTEVDGVEIFHVLAEIKHNLQHLDEWAAPKKVDAPITMLGTRSHIRFEPRGVCLIISPWNYPLSLCLGPLVSALAAGNAAVIKPSELTPHVSALVSKMAAEVFDPQVVAVVEGDAAVSQQLLKLPFDHIFFTGSPTIGKVVMKAAAENLTSVTLELGGKSPVVVTRSARLRDAARRVAFTKFLNNGQTCLAPDYVLVHEDVADKFVAELIAQTKQLFTENGGSFETSEHYCRIVNRRHFDRVSQLLADAVQQGATLAFGGGVDAATNFIHPTVLTRVPHHAQIMQEEIFGPLMPVLTYRNVGEAIAFINGKPKALALYVFGNDSTETNRVIDETSAGGVCINDCGVHFMQHNLPFGGVNNSGIGKSHGYYGFIAFSNEKPVLRQRSGFTSVSVFYPPYTASVRRMMDWFLKLF